MLAMISSSLMIFVDRLFLSRFDPIALNAAATGGIAYYIFLVLPTLLFVGLEKQGADVAWAIVAGMSVLHFLIYLCRYRSGGWRAHSHFLGSRLTAYAAQDKPPS